MTAELWCAPPRYYPHHARPSLALRAVHGLGRALIRVGERLTLAGTYPAT